MYRSALVVSLIALIACNPSKDKPANTSTTDTTEVDPVAPTVVFTSPADGDRFVLGDPVLIEVLAADADEADLQQLTFEWSGDAAGAATAPTNPDSGGIGLFYLEDLQIGSPNVTVKVIDTDGLSSQAAVLFEIYTDDADGDGIPSGDDCDDNDPQVGDGFDWFADTDSDGFGDPDDTVYACDAPTGYVADDTDCDDTDPNANPGETEVCDGVDNNCDNAIDEGLASDWFADVDTDGFGDAYDQLSDCTQPTGYVADDTDCNDTDLAVFPGAVEVCNGVDDNCDTYVDEGVLLTFYADDDSDGFGDDLDSVQACTAPSGYVADNTDCDDADQTAYPGAIEQCDLVDHDCEGTPDNGVVDVNWYRDFDTDGYGDINDTILDCVQPSGYVADDADCDDTDMAVFPGAVEACNGVDDNCNTFIDEGVRNTYYADNDVDGYGDDLDSVQACSAPSGYVADNTDCDDQRNDTYPGAPELCDGIDNDCDPLTLEGMSDWYADIDSDGYGDPLVQVQDCTQPTGYVSDNTDCDDIRNDVNPGAPEVCDGVDNDCDPLTVESPNTYYHDFDNDGFGDDLDQAQACTAPTGYVSDNTDCDDTRNDTYPGAPELCDGIDNDCDPLTGEGSTTYYHDFDNDGYGDDLDQVVGCSPPSGYILDNSDCNDANNNIHPGAPEACDGLDNNCDTNIDEGVQNTYYFDFDTDGFGDPLDTTLACIVPSGYVADNTDCDDTNIAIYPNAAEVCNLVDDDCDTDIDEGVQTTYYLDFDVDGYGDDLVQALGCSAPTGYVADNTDCDDTDPDISPGDPELCNGVDDNCDTNIDEGVQTTWYFDFDTDGFGDPNDNVDACVAPSNYVIDGSDCDDTNILINTSAVEVCDGVDNNCSGIIDDAIGGCAAACPVYADAAVPPGGDGSFADPFPSIAYAIAFRTLGCDEIVLLPGTFDENVDYAGEDLQISSSGGPTVTTVMSSTGGTIFNFSGGETAVASLSGVTITGGTASSGAGIYISASDPTITGNVIDNNDATSRGGGVYASSYDGLFENNTLTSNTASDGGGLNLRSSNALIRWNTFQSNYASDEGGAMEIYAGAATIEGNRIDSNTSGSETGGIRVENGDPIIINNLMVGNADASIYLYGLSTDGVVANNTVVNAGYAALQTFDYVTTEIVNNIFWNSSSYDVRFYSTASQASLNFENNNASSFYNASPNPIGSNGNIGIDPIFVGAGDYSLQWGSRSIDGGQDASGFGVVDDYDGTGRALGAAYDIGAYESYGTGGGCPGDAYCAVACPIYVDANVLPGGNGDIGNPFPSIAYAMTYGNGCTDILVEPGTYDENVDFGSTDYTLASVGGPAVTTLTSSVGGTIVRIAGSQTTAATLTGFTITGGTASSGAGIYISAADPTIEGNIIDNNDAISRGGGVYASSYDGTFENNTLTSNTASDGGGLNIRSSNATILWNTFQSNYASDEGGAMEIYSGAPTIEANRIDSNTSGSETGGIRVENGDPIIINNVMVGNADASIYLYGLSTDGIVANNTVVNAGYAALQTFDYVTTEIVNNIFWNSSSYDVRFYSTASQASLTFENNNASSFYNASPNPIGNAGNIGIDPLFVGAGDYSLVWGSRSIDGGQDVSGLGIVDDYDGTTRPLGAAYDMGAYESYGNPGSCPGDPFCATACPIYVDANVLPGGDGDIGAPFPSIAYAMTYGNGCADILVEPGTYDENIDFGSTDYTLTSTGGGAVTTLTSSVGGTIVRIAGSQTAAAELTGFTVTGGNESSGAGIYISAADPTISDNIIDNNDASSRGGGVYASSYDGLFENNTLTSNTASDGGAMNLRSSNALIRWNTFTSNYASDEGGAMEIYSGAPIIEANRIDSNTSGSETGGIRVENGDPIIINNVMVGNADASIYLYGLSTDGVVANNTVVNAGYAALQTFDYVTTDIVNNIFWNSSSYDVRFYSTASQASLTFENNNAASFYNASPNPIGSSGNIGIDPLFVGAGDYGLQWGSRSIDGGQDTAGLGVVDDFDGTARALGSAYDIGAYESFGTGGGCPADPYCAVSCPVYVDSAAVPGGNGEIGTPYPSIAYAQTYGNGCLEILVQPGTYDENVDFASGDYRLSSTGGAAVTTLTSSVGGTIVRIAGSQTSTSELIGFTITGGTASSGAGIYVSAASPTISDNIIDNNDATSRGGGIYASSYDGVFENNVLTSNTASDGGGMNLRSSDGIIRNNAFTSNYASDEGGAMELYSGAPLIEANDIDNNTSGSETGGIRVENSDPVIVNNVMVGNADASIYLYGLSTAGVVANNTIVNAGYAGLQTFDYVTTTIANNIIWNSSSYDVRFYSTASQASLVFENNNASSFYNASPNPVGSNGNIGIDPVFVGAGDYGLQWGSRSIDGGQDASGMGVLVDYDGITRELGAGWDMGAFESWGVDPDCTAGGPYCATACPVYVDSTVLPGGDGAVGNPYPNIAYAMTYGDGCLDMLLEPGTYDENVDFGVSDYTLASTSGAATTTLTSSVGGTLIRIAGGQTSSAMVSGLTLTGGTASSGAGLYISAADPTIVDNIIDNNDATSRGGGVYASSYDGLFDSNTLTSNTASDGGGLNLRSSTATISNNTFTSNYASDEGGAMEIYAGTPTIIANRIDSNTSGSETGGIRVENGDPWILNNVMVGNADASIYLYGLSTDGFVVNNTVVNAGYAGIQTFDYVTTVIANNIIWNSSSYDVRFYSTASQASLTFLNNNASSFYNASPNPIGLNGNIGIDPIFELGDYNIQWGSQCIDSGTNAAAYGVVDDFDGTPRPGGLGYDMGAYESW